MSPGARAGPDLDRQPCSSPASRSRSTPDGRIEAVGALARPARAARRASPCCPASSTPTRMPSSADCAARRALSRRARAASGPGARRCTRWSGRSTARRFARSRPRRSRRCATPASPPSASSTTCTTSARATSRSTRPCSRRPPTPASGWSCSTATTPPARRAVRSRAPSAASPRRRWTGSGGRLDRLAARTRSGHPDARRRAAQHPGGRPRRDPGSSTSRRPAAGCRFTCTWRSSGGRSRSRSPPTAAPRWRSSSTRCRAGASPRCTAPTPPTRTWQRFLDAGGTVCLCPLTEGNLGDGIPRLARRTRAGGRLAIGTDSNLRLAMLEEMRWLEYGQRLRGELRGALPDAAGERGAGRCSRRPPAAAPARWACRPGGSRRAAGPTSRRCDSARPPLAEVPPRAAARGHRVRRGERGHRRHLRRGTLAGEQGSLAS